MNLLSGITSGKDGKEIFDLPSTSAPAETEALQESADKVEKASSSVIKDPLPAEEVYGTFVATGADEKKIDWDQIITKSGTPPLQILVKNGKARGKIPTQLTKDVYTPDTTEKAPMLSQSGNHQMKKEKIESYEIPKGVIEPLVVNVKRPKPKKKIPRDLLKEKVYKSGISKRMKKTSSGKHILQPYAIDPLSLPGGPILQESSQCKTANVEKAPLISTEAAAQKKKSSAASGLWKSIINRIQRIALSCIQGCILAIKNRDSTAVDDRTQLALHRFARRLERCGGAETGVGHHHSPGIDPLGRHVPLAQHRGKNTARHQLAGRRDPIRSA